MSRVATRLLSLIMLMQSRGMCKACDLAVELDVSERTVHRYMNMLDEMGMPIYSERGPHGGYALLRGYKLPPLIFTPEEATVLYTGAQMVKGLLGSTYHDAVLGATAKLDNVLPDELRQEVANNQRSLVIGALTTMDYRPHAGTMDTLRQCMATRCAARLVYKAFGKPESIRLVDAYALTFQWGLWYLVGFCHLRQALRTFRVDRIRQAEGTDERFVLPPGFRLNDYFGQIARYERVYTIVVSVSADLAERVTDQYGHWMEIEAQPDDSIRASFEASDLTWATGWVLSLSGQARVVSPPELRIRIRDAAQAVLSSLTHEDRR